MRLRVFFHQKAPTVGRGAKQAAARTQDVLVPPDLDASRAVERSRTFTPPVR